MKYQLQNSHWNKTLATTGSICLCLLAAIPARALDDVGDQASNFTIVNHKTGAPLSLYDYAGSVILLDFFAYWCPYCQAQSPQIENEINEYFADRKGNSNAVPVTVITVSFDCSNQAYTDQLINQYGLDIVADDCSQTAYSQFGVSGQPYYVIINGITNSTSHLPWEVLHRQSSYGGTVAPSDTLRSVLEQVVGPPPELLSPEKLADGSFECVTQSYLGPTNRVEYTTNYVDWITLTNLHGTNGMMTVRDNDAGTSPVRSYRSVRE